ncbi:MAG TPA: sigma-70 family RNA polymerase sigma factor, partial [Planctomycetota bacterium]|nr:sigma-70 family RNA polymerase sigma factor [Planctomycetota bacterium]
MNASSPVPIEELLSHRAWVRALALSLARDASEADDLEQEAWLAAVRSPPRDRTSLRGWLGSVLRRSLGRGRRGEARRGRREASAAPGRDEPGPDEVVARAELHERLVRAVLELEEPMRLAILLRYFEGLSHAEIGRRTGTLETTVRSHVHRGLARLRERLGASHPGGPAGLAAALIRFSEEIGAPEPERPDGSRAAPAGARTRVSIAAAAALVLLSLAALLARSSSSRVPPAGPSAAGDPAARIEPLPSMPAGAPGDAPRGPPVASGAPAAAAVRPPSGDVSVEVALRFAGPDGSILEPSEAARLATDPRFGAVLLRADAIEAAHKIDFFELLRIRGAEERTWRVPLAVRVKPSGVLLAGAASEGTWRLALFLPGRSPWLSVDLRVAPSGRVDLRVPLP